MQNDKKLSAGAAFFLGANTPGGFYSLFDELCDPADGWRLYIIKGGPGTGKSTLLKTIAAEADRRGLYCERIHCSSDPASLDGVIVPSLKLSAADGTAPHVLEPKYPGVCETIVDLGAFRNDRKLREHREEILRLTDENKEKHAQRTRLLHAAGCAAADLAKIAADALELEKLERFVDHLSARSFGIGAGDAGKPQRRFLSALTPEGIWTFYETAEALCEKKIVLHDEIGLASSMHVESLAANAAENGCRVIRCPCPLAPDAKTEHLLLPELTLGVFTSNRRHPFKGDNAANVQCSRFLSKNEMGMHKNRLRFTARARDEMLAEALVRLREAKELHDELERYYVDAMDFAAVQNYAEKLLREIFEEA
jgi:hypothetical protein